MTFWYWQRKLLGTPAVAPAHATAAAVLMEGVAFTLAEQVFGHYALGTDSAFVDRVAAHVKAAILGRIREFGEVFKGVKRQRCFCRCGTRNLRSLSSCSTCSPPP
jgi:hypothetical protein